MNRYMGRYTITLAIAVSTVFGCSKSDPPCAREVYLQEADEALTHKARRLESEGKTNGVLAATWLCGYDRKPSGGYKEVDEVKILIDDVLWCLDGMVSQRGISLYECMEAASKSKFASHVFGERASTQTLIDAAGKMDCAELSRNVDIEAEKHGLQRQGDQSWVPIVIWGVLEAADKMVAPSLAPAMFIIRPGSGAEEACVDLPAAEPPKRCTDESGCLPSGAEKPSASTGSGDVVPPGSDPHDPGGDSP